MDKQKVKEILSKIGKEVEKWTKIIINAIKFIWDIITTCYVVWLGMLGAAIVLLELPILQAMNSGVANASPELSLISVLVCIGGLILISVPFIYLSLYWRITE